MWKIKTHFLSVDKSNSLWSGFKIKRENSVQKKSLYSMNLFLSRKRFGPKARGFDNGSKSAKNRQPSTAEYKTAVKSIRRSGPLRSNFLVHMSNRLRTSQRPAGGGVRAHRSGGREENDISVISSQPVAGPNYPGCQWQHRVENETCRGAFAGGGVAVASGWCRTRRPRRRRGRAARRGGPRRRGAQGPRGGPWRRSGPHRRPWTGPRRKTSTTRPWRRCRACGAPRRRGGAARRAPPGTAAGPAPATGTAAADLRSPQKNTPTWLDT